MKAHQNSNFAENKLVFPQDFLWGVATSHFQIEGNPCEINNRLSDWSKWTQDSGHIADQSSGDQACEFYHRFSSDIDLLSQLNLNAFRISLNWAAICPEPRNSNGVIKINEEVINYYRAVLQQAKNKNIKTFVTLFHFVLPSWLAEKGGWSNENTVFEFGKFAELVCQRLGDLVDFWQTINEPMVYAYHGYLTGSWPPGLKNRYLTCLQVIRNFLAGHALAYQNIHSVHQAAQVSYTMHWQYFTPKWKSNPLDVFVTRNCNIIFNHVFPQAVQSGCLTIPFPFNHYDALQKVAGPIDGLKDSADYLGINYYTRDVCSFSLKAQILPLGVRSTVRPVPVNALGWEIFPDGLYKLLTADTVPYQKNSQGKAMPIYITENGYASSFAANYSITDGDWSLDDNDRSAFLVDHLLAIYKAIKADINVKGYLHWSLLDNFEWAEGLRIRFGLIRVAYPGQERTLRESAKLYAKIAGSNTLPPYD